MSKNVCDGCVVTVCERRSSCSKSKPWYFSQTVKNTTACKECYIWTSPKGCYDKCPQTA